MSSMKFFCKSFASHFFIFELATVHWFLATSLFLGKVATMGLTATNLNTLQLLNIVNKTSTAQSKALTQLSTGFKINKAADDPAGLIAVENFNAELTAANAALENNQRSNAMLSTAESGLSEISSLLLDVEKLAVASVNDASLSSAERAANQAQIDAALASIDRIANTTTFNGKSLLNGSQSIDVTGVAANTVENLQVYSRGSSDNDVDVVATVDTAAAEAKATITLASGAKTTDAETVIEIQGTLGTATVTVQQNAIDNDIRDAINSVTDITGVQAATVGNDVVLSSGDGTNLATGSEEFVSLNVISGGTMSSGGNIIDLDRQEGVDAVVEVNGRLITADGGLVSYNEGGYSLAFNLGTSLDAVGNTETFTIEASGGMTFQLGSESNTRSTLGIDAVTSSRLGEGGTNGTSLAQIRSGGSADLNSKSANTLQAIRGAISQVASIKGRIGGFQKFQVETSINALTQRTEALTAARSAIADTDFAEASAELNRQSVLLNSGISLLGLANQQASQILSLLG